MESLTSTFPVSSRPTRPAHRLLGALLVSTGLHVLWIATGWGGAAWREILADLLPLPPLLFAALYLGRVAAQHAGVARRGWRAVQAATLAFAAGGSLWAYLELVAKAQPFPSVADAAYLLVTPLLTAAFWHLWPFPASRSAAAQLALDVLTFSVAAGVWFWHFLIAPTIAAHAADPLALVIGVIYPVYDLLLLSLVVVAALRRAVPPSLMVFALGLLSVAVGDLAFAYLTTSGRYFSGHPVDISWRIGFLLFALAAHATLHTERFPSRPLGRLATALPDLSFVLPFGAVLLTSVLLGLTYHQRGLGPQGVLVGAVLVTALVTLRQTLAWREAQRLQRELHVLNSDLEARVRERTLDVRRTFEGGLLALGTALEARDFETAGHTERVVKLARALGQALRLPPGDLEALTEGAYLHDLGKLTVPDHILLKPSKLTREEWTTMQSHAAQGHALALRLPHLHPGALDLIRSHHEKWDGSGYPSSLSGEAIPLLARIFAVCDVYDALTSVRPYKSAWTHEQATAEIQVQAGRHFDPRVAAAFLALDVEAVLTTSSAAPVLQQTEQVFQARVEEHTRVLRGTLADTETLLALSRLSEVQQDVSTVLREALAALAGSIAFDAGGALHIGKDTTHIEVLWQTSDFQPSVQVPAVVQLARGQGLNWTSVHGSAPVFVDGYVGHLQADALMEQAGVRALALLPLDPAPSGLLLIVARTKLKDSWSAQERALLEAAARTVRSVMERRRNLEELQRAALVDELTGLGNRRAFMRDLEAELGRTGTLVVLDVDGFKAVNDTHGHAQGDELLRELSGHLKETFPGGRAYRLGGDEFAVLVPEGNAATLRAAMIRVGQALRHGSHAVDISFGQAFFPGEGETLDSLLALADERMYALKRRRQVGVAGLNGSGPHSAGPEREPVQSL